MKILINLLCLDVFDLLNFFKSFVLMRSFIFMAPYNSRVKYSGASYMCLKLKREEDSTRSNKIIGGMFDSKI